MTSGNEQLASRVFLSVTLLTVLYGCGKLDPTINLEKSQSSGSGLTGAWQDGCSSLNWLGFSREKIDLRLGTIGDFHQSTAVFNDDACATPIATLEQQGTYTALATSQSTDSASRIDFALTTAKVTAHTDEVVEILNAASYCGVQTWVKGAPIDVIDKVCLGTGHPKGQISLDIYRLADQGQELTFGRDSLFLDKVAGGSRPVQLDGSRTFVRR